MSEAPTIFVCGLGRCGSSLTMQMLHAAGIPCVGEYPSFETWETNHAAITHDWLSGHHGHAAKMLDPFRSRIPDDANCVIIWLDRDATQQAKSQCKMVSMLSGTDVRSEWRGMRGEIRRDRRKCLKIINRWPVIMLSFESIILNPLETSRNLAGYLSPWINISASVTAMAKVVIPRPTDCEPGMAIESALVMREQAAADSTGNGRIEP